MGTWSAGIFGSDTACEIKELFLSKYNNGDAVADIKNQILEEYNFFFENEDMITTSHFALAYCLWEVCELDEILLNKVKQMVSTGIDAKILVALGADKSFIKKRGICTDKFIKKISEPKTMPKKRIKPPILLDSKFKHGDLLAFKYDDVHFGGAIVVDVSFYKNSGYINLALIDIRTKESPTLEILNHSKLLGFEWEEAFGVPERFIAKIINGEKHTGGLSVRGFDYDKASEREDFFHSLDKEFTIVGTSCKYTKILLATSHIAGSIVENLNFAYRRWDTRSEETIQELSLLLC